MSISSGLIGRYKDDERSRRPLSLILRWSRCPPVPGNFPQPPPGERPFFRLEAHIGGKALLAGSAVESFRKSGYRGDNGIRRSALFLLLANPIYSEKYILFFLAIARRKFILKINFSIHGEMH